MKPEIHLPKIASGIVVNVRVTGMWRWKLASVFLHIAAFIGGFKVHIETIE